MTKCYVIRDRNGHYLGWNGWAGDDGQYGADRAGAREYASPTDAGADARNADDEVILTDQTGHALHHSRF